MARRLLILYGSQTGTAQDMAERISREGRRRHFCVNVFSMDEYDKSRLIADCFCVFVCATTGQGDPPDNMRQFWRFLLRRDLPSDSLAHLQYCVIGLGDSSYQKFNFVAKKLYRRLQQLGACPFLSPVYGDDQHELGPDAVIDPWLTELWLKLESLYPLPAGLTVMSKSAMLPPRYKIRFELPTDEAISSHIIDCTFPSHTVPAQLLENVRVTSSSHFQDVRLLTLKGSFTSYSPGDVLVISPENTPETVERFLQVTCAEDSADKWFLVTPSDLGVPVPTCLSKPCCLRTLLTHYWDIQSVPKRSFFEILSWFAINELEREKLEEFSSSEGQEDLYSYCNRPRRTIIEVLSDFPLTAARIPLPYLFDLLPALQPRAFSIASSSKTDPACVQILMAVVKYKTKLLHPRRGVCTTWLASLDP